MSTKLARPGLPLGLVQPGRSSAIFAWVRSASMFKRVSWSPEPILPLSLTAIGPETAPFDSNPRRPRAASSSVAWARTSAVPPEVR